MPSRTMLMKTKWYPRPHQVTGWWGHGMESGVNNYATIMPMVMYDEAQGDPASYNAHPEHASFAEYAGPNCYPESRINNIIAEMTVWLTKAALETDKVHTVRGSYMPIFGAFLEDWTAIDELSSVEVRDALEIQTESTDRQAFPLFNNVDMKDIVVAGNNLHADVPGLTTDQSMEGVTWSDNTYYDTLHYRTNSKKLMNCQGGMRWYTLTKDRPFKKFRFRLRPKVKRMNPYAFYGVFHQIPAVDTTRQYNVSADTTDINHVGVYFNCRYNEWNQNFDFSRV